MGLKEEPSTYSIYSTCLLTQGLKKLAAAGYEMYMPVLVAPPNEIPQ
jgi:hypothetical protein